MALGVYAWAAVDGALAFGLFCSAKQANTLAFGFGITNNTANSMMFGFGAPWFTGSENQFEVPATAAATATTHVIASADGSRWRIGVSNLGVLTVVPA